jgi:hypothetical protein
MPTTTRENSSRERGNCGREMAGNFAHKWQIPCHLKGSFTCRKSASWDRRLYFPSEGMHAVDFFALKNPTASAGFEPANLGTRSQTTEAAQLYFRRQKGLDQTGRCRCISDSLLAPLAKHLALDTRNKCRYSHRPWVWFFVHSVYLNKNGRTAKLHDFKHVSFLNSFKLLKTAVAVCILPFLKLQLSAFCPQDTG